MRIFFAYVVISILSMTNIVAGAEIENLISNASLEQLASNSKANNNKLPIGWKAHRGLPLIMNDGGHTGDRYLRLNDTGPKQSLSFISRNIPARPGGKYTASVWMRTSDKGKPGVYINFYNDQGRRIHHLYSRVNGPTKDWMRVDVVTTAPAKVATVSVSLYSFVGDRGVFDFDDISLQVTGGDPPLSAPRVKPKVHDVVTIGSRRELFVDFFLIDGMQDAKLKLNRPRDEGVVFKFDKPWEGPFCGYCTIIKLKSGYRVYYRGRAGVGKDGDKSETTCIAESTDGIQWKRPQLSLFKVKGVATNNVVLKNRPPFTHNFSPWLDTRPDVSNNEKYKSICGTYPKGLALFVSADGLRWNLKKKQIITSKVFAFDSQACTFWSASEKQYVCYFRSWENRVRWISRTTSQDCLTWSKPIKMKFGSAPPEHLYTNQTHPYFRAPHLYLSTAARFMPHRQVISASQAKKINVNPKYFKDTSDAVLITSRGGNVYDRTFMTSFIRPGIGAKNWVSRTNYPALNIVQTGKTEMSIYTNQDYAQPTAHLHRYSMRLDGFASVRANYSGGELLTRPFIFSGKQLSINFATSAAGYIRVEIQSADGKPLPNFGIIDCQEQIGNEIERIVSWDGTTDLSKLAGKKIRLRFVMKDADLYAMQFQE